MKLDLVAVLISIAAVGLLGHNLLCHRKQGWGWSTLCLVAAAIAFIGRLAIAIFCEVSANNEIADWDE